MIDNLLYLEEISIEKVLEVLDSRFKEKQIYTNLGAVLLSTNPYEYFEGENNIYRFPEEKKESSHLWTTMDKIFYKLFEIKKDQVILVSGESGSGKTETVKLIVHYLNHYTNNVNDDLLTKIEASGLVLECFGNAKTEKNHNSSRFGKYIEVFYDKFKNCLGMTTSIYLLEKTRILKDVGNFHVFSKEPTEICELLTNAGFSEEQNQFVLETIEIVKDILKMEFDTIDEQLNLFDERLPENSMKNLLKSKRIKVQSEVIETPYNLEEFLDVRNAVAMKIYETLFRWLVKQMNIFYKVESYDRKIGILDIFGFEDLKENSLEQLAINYTNEILQGLLNKILIDDKIELYDREGISIEHIPIEHNTLQINTIEDIFCALDEESMFPRATDQTFIERLHLKYNNLDIYSFDKRKKLKGFSLEHYAGKIDYSVAGFLKKNVDKQNYDIDVIIDFLFKTENVDETKSGKLRMDSITNQFRNDLNIFLDKIKEADLHFIKCIKPNLKEQSMYFDSTLVKEQLQYNGILGLIRILKQGYSYHFDMEWFKKEYRNIYSEEDNDILFGITRVFVTETYYNNLKALLKLLRIQSSNLIKIKALASSVRLDYVKRKQTIITLQNHVRTKIERTTYYHDVASARIQRYMRYNLERNQYIQAKAQKCISRFILMTVKNRKLINSLNNRSYLVSLVERRIIRRRFAKSKVAAIILSQWWKRCFRWRKDYANVIKKLKETVSTRDKEIINLEQKILWHEQQQNKSIIVEKDTQLVNRLRADLEMYQKSIQKRLSEKMELFDKIEKLESENNLLLSQITYLKNQNRKSWFYKLFG